MPDTFPLSPIDHIFTGRGSYPIEFIFLYEGHLDEKSLRSSLAETIKYFPAVSSKLERITEYSFGLRFSEAGIQFNVAETSDDFYASVDRSKFIDPVETFENQPLAKIKLTRLPAGSVLGVSISHAIADGFSYFYFLSSWAKIHNGLSVIPPDNNREKLIPDTAHQYSDPGFNELYNNCGLFLLEKRNAFSREQQQWKKITYTAPELKSIVTLAQAESSVRLSVNDVVTSLLWKELAPQWRKGADENTYVSCPVDFRRSLPGFPRNYFGDALCLATTKLTLKALSDAKISELAGRIRSSIARINEAFIKSSMLTLQLLRKQKGLNEMECIHVVHPNSGLLVTNLSRLPVNELIFNCGPPVASDILTTAQRGAVILPAGEGIEVRVCLPDGVRN